MGVLDRPFGSDLPTWELLPGFAYQETSPMVLHVPLQGLLSDLVTSETSTRRPPDNTLYCFATTFI